MGLNLALALHKRGSLRRLGVRILGTDIEGIARGEDREAFRELMHAIGEPVPRSATVQSVAEGLAFAREVSFPLILRPAFTLGGEGSGIAHDVRELEERLETALALSPIHQVLVEESIVGWKEIEFEGLRDVADEVLIVTAMENVDPMGIHTGDSVVVAPAFTVPPEDLARMAQAATRIYRAVGLVGGANIQFAYHPERREYRVIEINPRVSRSSALASKATGYPIAWATTKLSLGYTLRELPHPMLRGVSLADPPVLRGQVVLKVPRFAFDKFPDADRSLGTTMKATGRFSRSTRASRPRWRREFALWRSARFPSRIRDSRSSRMPRSAKNSSVLRTVASSSSRKRFVGDGRGRTGPPHGDRSPLPPSRGTDRPGRRGLEP